MLTARDGKMRENQQLVRLHSGENNPYRKQMQKLNLVICSFVLSSIYSVLENMVQITG